MEGAKLLLLHLFKYPICRIFVARTPDYSVRGDLSPLFAYSSANMELEQRIREITEAHLPDAQYFITDIRAKGGGAKTKIAIFIDGDKGIDIGTCGAINKQVGREMEQLGLLEGPYTLEVSSPGLDQPLKLPRQYHRNLGKNVRVTMESEQVEGELEQVTEAFITVKQSSGKGITRQIPFSEIIKTQVLVSF